MGITEQTNSELPFDDVFNNIEDDSEEPMWDKLTQKIIEGNVIPVIGPEVLRSDINIHKYLIEGFGRKIGMSNPPNSFSELVYSKEFENKYKNKPGIPYKDRIYYLVNEVFSKRRFPSSILLKEFLSIRQFPFVITTSFTPIVEDIMKEVWGNELKVMRFCPKVYDDIKEDADLRKPTVYYMFGKVGYGLNQYALTDIDMLNFVSSWVSDENRPKNLCSGLKDKYLLMLGNNYSNWLFRFIWFSMRKQNIGEGMFAYDSLDDQLINFLERADTFTKQNTSEVFTQIITRLNKKLKEYENTKFYQPGQNIDVFISYSRRDSDIAEKLYKALTEQGKNVWYDKYDITAGGKFKEEINRAIRAAKYFIPIFTQNIIKEKNESHVYRNEWNTAIETAISLGRRYLIPLANVDFDFYRASLPEKIQEYNAVLFSTKDNFDDIANNLIHIMNQDDNGKYI